MNPAWAECAEPASTPSLPHPAQTFLSSARPSFTVRGYLLTSATTAAGQAVVEVLGGTLSLQRLPT